MTVLSVLQLLTFLAFLGLLVFAAVVPREANPAKRTRKTRLYSGSALIAGAAFFAALAAGLLGWSRYVLAVVAVGFLAAGLVAIAKSRPKK
ncbi:hypothetical protein NWT09_01390 [Mycolicibacterium sp. jd]|uniref:hypothetical protein n=1 Tax=unclassified Mycolicibacterium TaxID=2636767 RepID=UPI00351B425F